MHEIVIPVMVLGIVGSSFIFVGWVLWMIGRARKEKQQSEMQIRARMIEKFGTAEEFVGFLETDAGKKFLASGPAKAVKSSKARVAASLSWGAVVFMFGLAMFFMGWVEGDREMMAPGTVFTAIGIGLAITAYIYHRIGPDTSTDDVTGV